MKRFLFYTILIVFFNSCSQKQDMPNIFLPGLVSDNSSERDLIMNSDETELFFTVMGGNYCHIAYSKKKDNKWTYPDFLNISGNLNYFDLEPCLSFDGSKLYFMSTRAETGQKQLSGWVNENIWMSERSDSGEWLKPKKLGKIVNFGEANYYPSISNNNNLYFTSSSDGKRGIYRTHIKGNSFSAPVKLSDKVNINDNVYNSYIAADESFIIICTRIEGNVIGMTDYYISFKSEQNEWTDLINMGSKVNFEGSYANSIFLSPNKKTLYFSANIQPNIEKRRSLKYMRNLSKTYENGRMNIYQCSSSIIDSLRNIMVSN
ncbi:MAG: hypothetical protein N4A49_06510 [Marinifilaceae bacterium]|jgi:hypothetical protein|nr:hypothetical protein [Marinifilaceae bacterium]